MSPKEQLDGWKTIGAYLGRDRTTVMRWARDRGMPVYAVPGGKTRTVYAIRSELDAWAGRGGTVESQPSAVEVPDPQLGSAPSAPAAWWSRRRLVLAAAAAAALVAAGFAVSRGPARSDGVPAMLPRDAAAARLFVHARDAWAQRTAASTAVAVDELEAVVRREPRFARGYAALAEAYLLRNEVGELPDAITYPKARKAAERAVSLAPELADAHRALGFVAYWWEGDRAAAGQEFRTALRLAPDAAQTHFWYANALSDNGEFPAAFREFDKARLLDPGSLPISVDFAWSRWQATAGAEASRKLAAIAVAHPDYAEVFDCLSMISLGEGNIDGYRTAIIWESRLSGNPDLAQLARQLQAMPRGHSAAAAMAIIAYFQARAGRQPFPDHVVTAFAASALSERDSLLKILRLADARDEQWGNAGYRRAIAARWRDDRVVTGLLARRAPPRMEPEAR